MTPTASGSACSPPAARTSCSSRPASFGTTALPLLGANPPKPKARPPLRNDVPCETQQPPDLRSTAGAPPPQHRVDTNDAAFKARWAKVRKYGID